MLNEFNNINLSGWKDNPNVSVEISRVIEKASWLKSPFEPFVGRGQDRGIRTYGVKNNQPFRPRLKAQLTGEGVAGNADFETNLDNLEILSQTIYPKVIGNSLKSEIKQYSAMEQVDFIKEAMDSLADWIADKRDRQFVSSLTNDLSNVVVCDAAQGFKDSSNCKDTRAAAKATVRGDYCNVRALRQAIFMARNGVSFQNKPAFPIKPLRSQSYTVGNVEIMNHSYIILLDSYQAIQLKNDPEWISMQKVGVRGDKNNFFTGLIGLIDDCPVLDMGVWTPLQVGLLNSEVSDSQFYENIHGQNFSKLTPPSQYAGSQPVSIGFLIGASALIMAGDDSVRFYIDDTQDLGRKIICGCDRLMAISKARFVPTNGFLSPYANQDFATIGIISSKE